MTMLSPIIDYVSISIPTPNLIRQWEMSDNEGFAFFCDDRTYAISELMGRNTDWKEYPKGGIFKRHIQFHHAGMNYFEGHQSVSLLQISGQGCEILRNEGILDGLIQTWQDRITRIDVAVDIVCDITPEVFIQHRIEGRFKDGGHYPSESGTTWYIGSRKSDRFARVYRRNYPDPRCDKLRIEYQHNDAQAKLAAKSINDSSLDTFSHQLGASFGWIHPIFVRNTEFGKAHSISRPSSKGNTQYWLHRQVIPSLRKSAEMGDIETVERFFNQIRDIIEEYHNERDAKNASTN